MSHTIIPVFQQVILIFIPLLSEVHYCHMCIEFKNNYYNLNKLVVDENLTTKSMFD